MRQLLTCFVRGCTRPPVRAYLIWIGGERVKACCCGPHEAEHRVAECVDAVVTELV